MTTLFTINNKEIKDINTTILHTSDFNYLKDIQEYLNNNCAVITKENIAYLDCSPAILSIFNSEYLISKKDYTLIDKIKINILNNLNDNKKIYVFFNVLTYLDTNFKTILINYLKEKNKVIINYSTDIEETLLLDYLIVLQNNTIIMEGNYKEILKEEKILKKLGFNLPFILELSLGLKYYNLTNDLYYDNESLVNYLWK